MVDVNIPSELVEKVEAIRAKRPAFDKSVSDWKPWQWGEILGAFAKEHGAESARALFEVLELTVFGGFESYFDLFFGGGIAGESLGFTDDQLRDGAKKRAREVKTGADVIMLLLYVDKNEEDGWFHEIPLDFVVAKMKEIKPTITELIGANLHCRDFIDEWQDQKLLIILGYMNYLDAPFADWQELFVEWDKHRLYPGTTEVVKRICIRKMEEIVARENPFK